MFRSVSSTIFRASSAVLCAFTIPPADLRSLSLYYYAVCGRMCMSSVIQQFLRIISTMFMISRIWKVRHLIWRRPDIPVCVCLVFLSVGDLHVNCSVMCVGAVLVRRVWYINNKWVVFWLKSLLEYLSENTSE